VHGSTQIYRRLHNVQPRGQMALGHLKTSRMRPNWLICASSSLGDPAQALTPNRRSGQRGGASTDQRHLVLHLGTAGRVEPEATEQRGRIQVRRGSP
jgi:hypothetical protein